jgi:uncharacterized membrane protein
MLSTGKVILYLLYLVSLVLLTIQAGLLQTFQETQATILEAFIFGSTLSFLVLHILLGIRFLVITTSFVIPFNRKYVQPMMNKLFKDDQIAPLPFFLTLAGVLAAVFLNQQLSIFPVDTFAIVLVILCTQLFFRPSHKTEVV